MTYSVTEDMVNRALDAADYCRNPDTAKWMRAALEAARLPPDTEGEAQPVAWQNLSCDEQFDLATKIAGNIGYNLTPETAEIDAPAVKARDPELQACIDAASKAFRETFALFASPRPAVSEAMLPQLGGAPDDLHNLIKVVFADMTIEQMGEVCREVIARRMAPFASPKPSDPSSPEGGR